MYCKGICVRHKAGRAKFKLGRYESGQKRCQVCQIFIKWDGGIWCPCCSHKLRSNPRNIKFRHKQLLARRRLNADSTHKTLVTKPTFILLPHTLTENAPRLTQYSCLSDRQASDSNFIIITLLILDLRERLKNSVVNARIANNVERKEKGRNVYSLCWSK